MIEDLERKMESNSSDILEALDRGEIDAQEAIRQLEGNPSAAEEPAEPGVEGFEIPRTWRYLWLIPVALGVIGLLAGYGLATLAGWWWLLAGPVLLTGAALFLLGLASVDSPWVHVRVQSNELGAVKEFGLSLPLPLQPVSWVLKVFGRSIPGLERTALDELLVAMEVARQSDGPFFVDVREEDSGERVRVYLG